MDIKKLLFVDVETTGTNSYKDFITELAVIHFNRITKESCTKRWYCNPPFFPGDYEEKVVPVTGLTAEFLKKEGLEDSALYREFLSFLQSIINPYDVTDKALLVGYNPRFDLNFLHALFRRNNDNYFNSYIYSYPFDVACLVQMAVLQSKLKLPINIENKVSFKLSDVLKSNGINPENSHSALDDIQNTRKLFDYVYSTASS